MKKSLLALAFAATLLPASAASFMIDGKEYSYDLITSKSVGPGTTYNRIRIPDFPLNINYMVVDLNNPYNSIETQQANERTGSTELLSAAYTRMQNEGKKPIGAQNGNFWAVASQGIYADFALSTTFNACLKNGAIITETNAHNDPWDGGPSWTGVIGLDDTKTLNIQSMTWRGYVTSDVWSGGKHEFYLANKFCRAAGEMVLYNSYYGRTKKFQTIDWVTDRYVTVDNATCEVYLDLDEGEVWKTNGDIAATVKAVRTDCEAGTLGEYDACLCGTSSWKVELEKLKPGDKVKLNYAWTSLDGTTPYNLTQAIGGNAMVMIDGELTERNENETYNSQVYSRSAYGMAENGKKLYMFVIDKSIDPVYGNSNGCNTSVMCQIMKQLGAETVCNVDAGGSAQLMVQGNVVNKTTEGTPRAVANGWMVYSIAPNDDQSNVIARLEFLDPEIKLPVYTTYKPTILGYNKYGELISENVEGVTLEIDAAYGTAEGDHINIGGTFGETTVTAKLGDVTVKKTATIIESEVAVRLSNILIDGRDYPIEVIAKAGVSEYNCDPSRLTWTVDDESVATITNGVLKGVKNGTTKISGTIGNFSSSATVIVELPEATAMPIFNPFPTDIALKQVGGDNIAIAELEKGFKLTYTGKSGRGPYIELTKDQQIWSLPEKLRVRINPGDAIITKVTATAKNALGETTTVWVATENQLPNNEISELEFNPADWCDANDIGIYPITLQKLRFTTGTNTAGKDYEILVPGFEGIYNKPAGIAVNGIAANSLKIYPNPITDGVMNIILAEGICGDIAIYNMAGGKVFTGKVASANEAVNVSGLAAGLYLVEVRTADGVQVARIIIK